MTDDEFATAIYTAMEERDLKAVPILLAELAKQNPQCANDIRAVILAGLAIAKERHQARVEQ